MLTMLAMSSSLFCHHMLIIGWQDQLWKPELQYVLDLCGGPYCPESAEQMLLETGNTILVGWNGHIVLRLLVLGVK
jgi:hypothetical protein